MRRTIEIAALAVAIFLAALAFHAWLGSRDDQLRLQATLDSQKQLLDAADTRERDRAASLSDTLAQIEALKRSTQTPQQILHDLPKYLSLPQPINVAPSNNTVPAIQGTATSFESVPFAAPASSGAPQQGTSACPEGSTVPACPDFNLDASKTHVNTAISRTPDLPSSPNVQIPAADLKPLYDFVQDCRACQAQLASAKLDAADNAMKITALTNERDAAITVAKGGGFWLRLRRNVRWFAVGAGAGVVALCGTGHCRL